MSLGIELGTVDFTKLGAKLDDDEAGGLTDCAANGDKLECKLSGANVWAEYCVLGIELSAGRGNTPRGILGDTMGCS